MNVVDPVNDVISGFWILCRCNKPPTKYAKTPPLLGGESCESCGPVKPVDPVTPVDPVHRANHLIDVVLDLIDVVLDLIDVVLDLIESCGSCESCGS